MNNREKHLLQRTLRKKKLKWVDNSYPVMTTWLKVKDDLKTFFHPPFKQIFLKVSDKQFLIVP